MAFRCDDCQYIYEKKRTSCPFCGGRVYNDASTNVELLNAGFIWAPGSPSKKSNDRNSDELPEAEAASADRPSSDASSVNSAFNTSAGGRPNEASDISDAGLPIDISDISAGDRPSDAARDNDFTMDNAPADNPFENLRREFFSTAGGQGASSAENTPAAPSPDIPAVEPDVPVVESNASAASNPDENDFFAGFESAAADGGTIPTVEPDVVSGREGSDSAPFRNTYERELHELERERRREERRYRIRAAFNRFTNRLADIRWRTVLRILLIIAIIIAAIGVWNMRYVIFNSIVSFLCSLIPIVIIVWILWRLVRSMFR